MQKKIEKKPGNQPRKHSGKSKETPKEAPDRRRRPLCRFLLVGACQKDRCHFSHNFADFPCKFLWVYDNCKEGPRCKFSHRLFESADDLVSFVNDNHKIISESLANDYVAPIARYASENGLLPDDSKLEPLVAVKNEVAAKSLKEEFFFDPFA